MAKVKAAAKKPESQKGTKSSPLRSLSAVADAELRISVILRKINEYTISAESERQAVNEREAALIGPLQKKALDLGICIHAYAEDNRADLTEDGARSVVELPKRAGVIQWQRSPPSVSIDDVDTVISNIKRLGFLQFIRIKEEINKEALLQDEDRADTISGVSIVRGEKFTIKPNGIDERLERNNLTKKWKISKPKM